MDIDNFVNGIKEGRTVTLACSRYEQYFWYKDGRFYTNYEDGINERPPKEVTESYVRRDISIAIHHPECWDVYFDI